MINTKETINYKSANVYYNKKTVDSCIRTNVNIDLKLQTKLNCLVLIFTLFSILVLNH